jgi:hypothetical protein
VSVRPAIKDTPRCLEKLPSLSLSMALSGWQFWLAVYSLRAPKVDALGGGDATTGFCFEC